jgi:hypothetical protein
MPTDAAFIPKGTATETLNNALSLGRSLQGNQ